MRLSALLRLPNLPVPLLLSALLMRPVDANWIDPDTPLNVRTTRPLNVKAPPKYVPPVTKTKSPAPTTSPAPTSSTDAPTDAPTTSPTMFPTFNPERTFDLVFSDEFNVAGREFRDGSDPRWTAIHKNDYTNDALHYYTPERVTTDDDGHLVITTTAETTTILGFDDVQRKKTKIKKHFSSGMLQSWNKFCLTGGIVEARVTLPGSANVGGLWPAFWLLGNLARHTYVASSEHVWPWSSSLPCQHANARAQAISACHSVSHYGMRPHFGRGAPEMDVFEVQPGNIKANNGPFLKMPVGQPFASASYQVAPGRRTNRPGNGEWPGPNQWYSGLMGGRNATPNILFYGTYNHFRDDVSPAKQDYWSDAVSYNQQLNASHFEAPHTYRLEWDVPSSNASHGYLHWFLDNELVYSLDGAGLAAAQTGAEVSSEPSYIILNTAVSKQWGFPPTCPANCPCKTYDCNSKRWQDVCGFSEGFCSMLKNKTADTGTAAPPAYKIDWIRAYQDSGNPQQKVGCSTPERPTRKFIKAFSSKYKQEHDETPLRGIPVGLGPCSSTDDCGGTTRGRCTGGHVCECHAGWTGPHCRASVAYNDIEYDVADTILDVGFIPPRVAPLALYGGLASLLVLLVLGMQCRQQLAVWAPTLPPEDAVAAVKLLATRSV